MKKSSHDSRNLALWMYADMQWYIMIWHDVSDIDTNTNITMDMLDDPECS